LRRRRPAPVPSLRSGDCSQPGSRPRPSSRRCGSCRCRADPKSSSPPCSGTKRTVARSRMSALGICGLNDQSKLSSVPCRSISLLSASSVRCGAFRCGTQPQQTRPTCAVSFGGGGLIGTVSIVMCSMPRPSTYLRSTARPQRSSSTFSLTNCRPRPSVFGYPAPRTVRSSGRATRHSFRTLDGCSGQ
jgi:hypothetical protein